MKLIEFLKKKKIKNMEFAKMLNIGNGHMSLIANGKIIPRKPLIQKIMELTNNKVTLKDFYE